MKIDECIGPTATIVQAAHDGVIDEEYEPTPQDPEDLSKAVARLLEEFPVREVEVYLATLVALDPDTWGGLALVFRQ